MILIHRGVVRKGELINISAKEQREIELKSRVKGRTLLLLVFYIWRRGLSMAAL